METVKLDEGQEKKSRNPKLLYKGNFVFLLLLIIFTDLKIESYKFVTLPPFHVL